MRYRAFLSYSHADEKWARWLLRRLESYRVPANLVGRPGRDGPIPARLGAMFRDRDELPSAGSLSNTIAGALSDSQNLIVICSPNSAQSRWVNAEVDAFRSSGRGDSVLSFIVDGDPASRDVGKACFPAAVLRPHSDGGPEHEPLAADARKQGDGRDRAFIKLVAGLLGVGFDDLAQREAQQRHRRMAIVTAASLSGMTLAVVLAVTAYIARNDAERRQAQAEDILGFMLGDLRKNLTRVGRLDLMRAVDDKATGYFATLNPRDLSDRTLEEQARSLTGIGTARIGEGKNDEAMAAFREAHARTSALYLRQPGNGNRLFDLSQAEYWIGFVALQQSRYEDAEIWLTKYRDSGIRLAAMDRENLAWQQESVYGYQNLAALSETLGKYDEAEQAMLASKDLYGAWVKQYPGNFELRFEAANVDSWLGSLALREGRLAAAEVFYTAQAEAIQRNLEEDPGNAKWKEIRLDTYLFLATVQAQLGKRDQAKASALEAKRIGEQLTIHDPKNILWASALGQSLFWLAQLTDGSEADVQAYADEAIAIFGNSHAQEPTNEVTARWFAKGRNLAAELAILNGNAGLASEHAKAAMTVVAPFWKLEQTDSLRVVMATAHLLSGQADKARGDLVQAQVRWNQALAILSEGGLESPPFGRLDVLVRTLKQLGRHEEAEIYRRRLEKYGYVPLTSF